MHWIDWAIVGVYLVWIVHDGLKRTKAADRVDGYFLANRSIPWWAAGLSVMATQLSAITLVGTTGQGYADGMRFVQFYFGLPVAMIILSVTLVPFFYRSGVYTAYQYLERRFDLKTRTLAAVLFLISRGASCGVIIAAPAVILSIVFGWDLTLTVLAIGLPTTLYTMFGGVQAVTWTDVKQMAVIVLGVAAAVGVLIAGLPGDVGVSGALRAAGMAGRLRSIDFTFDLNQTYTFWSGLIGGLFLMLSYFGCDQSQVQRYLTAKSVDGARRSLLMSAFVKIPLQALILLTGVLVFAFFLFTRPPVLFNPDRVAELRESSRASEYDALDERFGRAWEARRDAARAGAREAFLRAELDAREIRREAGALVRDVTGDGGYTRFTGELPTPDVNYVFPHFIIRHLPIGLIGLMIAAIFAAAMSSIAAELNALATASVIDVYQRHFRQSAPDRHYLVVSKIATGLWGLFACWVATFSVSLGSLIEVVNRFGSFFYGSILGVFVLAVGTRRATGHGAFVGLIAGMTAVALVAFSPATKSISFLWHNVVGVVVVVVVGMAVSQLTKTPQVSSALGRR